MKKLLACLFVLCFASCNFTREERGQVLVNQQLIESNIRAVQPAEHVDLSIHTTNGHDSTLIVTLTVSSKILNDSLNSDQANRIIASFIAILPSMRTYSAFKVIFFKKEGIITRRSIEYMLPMTDDLASRVQNYKDSTKTSMGFMSPGWTYINKDLNFSVALKPGWFFMSDENDSLVFYPIGSDLNQLPQYRLDSNRKVTYSTISSLDPGSDHPVLQICKNNVVLKPYAQGLPEYGGPVISFGLVMNIFNSEDEYLKNLNEVMSGKKLAHSEIQTYHFGNSDFRGHQFSSLSRSGKMIHFLMVIRRFRRVTLMVRIIYSSASEFEEIKQELSGLTVE